jgi:hypothetical protein
VADGAAPRERRHQARRGPEGRGRPLRDASAFLRGLLAMLQQTGRKGLVLVLDEVETLQRMRSDVREKSLNALRQWIDDIDAGRYPGLYLLVTGTPAFFDGNQGVKRLRPAGAAPPRGLRRRPALGQRPRGAGAAAALRRRAARRGGPQGARPLSPRRTPTALCAGLRRLHRGARRRRDARARRQGRHRAADLSEEARRRRARPRRHFDDFDPASHFSPDPLAVGAHPGGVRGRGDGPQRRRHRARLSRPARETDPTRERRSPTPSTGSRRRCATRSSTPWDSVAAARAGALDARDPRRLQLRGARADRRRKDGVGVLPRAERDGRRRVGPRLGALRGARRGRCSTTRTRASPATPR